MSKPIRYFFITYIGIIADDGRNVQGHLAFNSQGFPSLVFITEQLIPEKSDVKILYPVITYLFEFKNEEDFDDFTLGRDMGDELGDRIRLN